MWLARLPAHTPEDAICKLKFVLDDPNMNGEAARAVRDAIRVLR